MNSEKFDYLGWILPLAAALLAISAAFKSGSDASFLFASAVMLLVVIERRRTKVITAALIRIVDGNGTIRGLVGYAGGGVQVGVRADSLYSGAIVYGTLWQNTPNVAFTFGYSKSVTGSGELIECALSIGVGGNMAGQWRSYSMNFSYKETTSKPDVSIDEHHKDGILCHSIHLS